MDDNLHFKCNKIYFNLKVRFSISCVNNDFSGRGEQKLSVEKFCFSSEI